MRTSTRASPSGADAKASCQVHRDKQRIFGVVQEVDGDAIAGVENDAMVDRDLPDRVRDARGEPLLDLELLGDGLLGVVDDIQKQDGADERPIGPFGAPRKLRDAGAGGVLVTPRISTPRSEQLLHLYRPGWGSEISGNRVGFPAPNPVSSGGPAQARCAAFLSSSIIRLRSRPATHG